MKKIYDREREMEVEMGVEDADAMAWEEEEDRHFGVEMSRICEECEQWHKQIVQKVAENRRIHEAECDRTQMEYEMDRKWMAEELAELDLEQKLKWLQEENNELEEKGEQWDRLGTYTESDCEILQVAIMMEEKEKEKDFTWSVDACERKKEEERRATNIAQKEKGEG